MPLGPQCHRSRNCTAWLGWRCPLLGPHSWLCPVVWWFFWTPCPFCPQAHGDTAGFQFNLVGTICQLRRSRNQLVQTPSQLGLCYTLCRLALSRDHGCMRTNAIFSCRRMETGFECSMRVYSFFFSFWIPCCSPDCALNFVPESRTFVTWPPPPMSSGLVPLPISGCTLFSNQISVLRSCALINCPNQAEMAQSFQNMVEFAKSQVAWMVQKPRKIVIYL